VPIVDRCETLRRVEDVVVPLHRVLKLLALTESIGDEERGVEEELPVVRAVRASVAEVHALHWVGRSTRCASGTYVPPLGVGSRPRDAGRLLLRQLQEPLDSPTIQIPDELPGEGV